MATGQRRWVRQQGHLWRWRGRSDDWKWWDNTGAVMGLWFGGPGSEALPRVRQL